MSKEKKKYKNLGLWVPVKVLKMSFLSPADKLFYAYVYSFGERGCWQEDDQIGKALGCSGRSVQRYQANCKKAGLFKVTGEGTPRRRIWAKAHPKYKAWRKKRAAQLRQMRRGTSPDSSRLPRQNRPTTNKGTNKTTNKQRGGSPSPAEQAHAPRTDLSENSERLPTWLEWLDSKGISDRTPIKDKQQQLEAHRMKEETIGSIEQLKRSFGRGRRRTPELTAAERQQKAQQQRQALLTAGSGPEKAKKS